MNFSLCKLLNDCQLIAANSVTEYNNDFESGIESVPRLLYGFWVEN